MDICNQHKQFLFKSTQDLEDYYENDRGYKTTCYRNQQSVIIRRCGVWPQKLKMMLVCNKGFKMELKTKNNQKMLFSWKAKYSFYSTACHGVLKNGSAESRNKSAKSSYANRPDQVSELNTFYRRLVEVLIKVRVLIYRWCSSLLLLLTCFFISCFSNQLQKVT